MAGTLVQLPRQSPLHGGVTVPGAYLFVYDAGTSTKRAVYTTKALSVALDNPVEADDNGRFPAVYLDETAGDYKLVLAPQGSADPPTSTYWSEDNIPASAASATPYYDVITAETTANVTIEDPNSPVFHVERYGADPTGTNDSSAAFQAAADVAAATARNGATVEMGPGTYKLLTRVVAPGRVIFKGHGMNATRINLGTGVNGFKFVNDTVTNEIEGGGIEDCSVSHDTCTIVVECEDVWGLKFRRVFFRDGGAGSGTIIQTLGECFEMRVEDCRILGADTYGIDMQAISNSCTVRGCDFALNNGCTAIRVQTAFDCVIAENRIEYAGADTGTKIEVDGSNSTVIAFNDITQGTSGYAIVIKGGADGTKIIGNDFSTSGSAGCIDVQNGDYGVISSNEFQIGSTSGDQIKAGGRTGWAVTGNTFRVDAALASSANLILVNSSALGWAITGNTMSGEGAGANAGTGIQIDAGSTFVNVVGNVFYNLNTGIDTQANNSSPSVVIEGNSFSTLTTKITVGTAASNRIRNNPGYMSENSGATSVADGGTITHGLETTPTKVRCTPTVSGELVSVTATGSTTFTVAIKKHDNSAGTTQTVYWEAEV